MRITGRQAPRLRWTQINLIWENEVRCWIPRSETQFQLILKLSCSARISWYLSLCCTISVDYWALPHVHMCTDWQSLKSTIRFTAFGQYSQHFKRSLCVTVDSELGTKSCSTVTTGRCPDQCSEQRLSHLRGSILWKPSKCQLDYLHHGNNWYIELYLAPPRT